MSRRFFGGASRHSPANMRSAKVVCAGVSGCWNAQFQAALEVGTGSHPSAYDGRGSEDVVAPTVYDVDASFTIAGVKPLYHFGSRME